MFYRCSPRRAQIWRKKKNAQSKVDVILLWQGVDTIEHVEASTEAICSLSGNLNPNLCDVRRFDLVSLWANNDYFLEVSMQYDSQNASAFQLKNYCIVNIITFQD